MKKVISLVIITAMMLMAFAGCGQATPSAPAEGSVTEAADAPSVEATEAPAEAPAEPVVLNVVGSTSVGPAIEAMAELYIAANPNVTINVEQPGSGGGVTATADGSADLGMASRSLKDEELAAAPDLQTHVLCIDGVAVIVNSANTVTELTAEQVKKIYLGEITDWSAVGGSKGKITLYSRDEASGTRGAFQELFLGKDDKGEEIKIDDKKCLIVDSNGSMGASVEGDPMGIGYMSLGLAPNYKVTSLKLDGVDATVENLRNGTYAYKRPFNLLTLGDPKPEVKAFMDFCVNDQGALDYMAEKGYVKP